MSKLILIVNYNKKILESETIKAMLKLNSKIENDYKIFIWDNCPIKENKEEIKKLNKRNFDYKESLENKGLAFIYNYIIEKEVNKVSHIILLDNDSELTMEYFLEFEEIIKENKKIELILPKIILNNQVYSPSRTFPKKIKKSIKYNVEDYGIKPTEDITSINSGMIISTQYILKNNFKYDSRLNFYGTDDYFMQKFRENKKEFYLMKYKMQHDLSLNNDEELSKVIWRYSDCKNGGKILREDYSFFEKIPYFIRNIKSLVEKSIKYKTLKFFKV